VTPSSRGLALTIRQNEWYTCNDEEVILSRTPQNKRIRLDIDEAKESSRDSYMLVYQKRGRVAADEPPKEIMERVQVENAAFEVELNEIATK
jgi:hypothetical protein